MIICKSTVKLQNIQHLINLLEPLRGKYPLYYKLKTANSINSKEGFRLFKKHKSLFTLVIVESIDLFNYIEIKRTNQLVSYCKEFQIGILVLLTNPEVARKKYAIGDSILEFQTIENKDLNNCFYENEDSGFFQINKFNKVKPPYYTMKINS